MSRRSKKNRSSRKPDRGQSSSSNQVSEAAYVYGLHAVEQLLRSAPTRVKSVTVAKDRKDQRIQSIHQLANQNQVHIDVKAQNELNKRWGDAVHQGVIAEITPAQVQSESFLEQLLVENENPFLLVLDQVQDPHNVGAILRSAAAVGVDAVIAPNRNACGLTGSVRKVAVGAAELVPYVQVTNLARTLRMLADEHVRIYGLAGETDKSIYDLTPDASGVAIVMGNEAKGLRRLTREHCDELVKIPMSGAVESLNVSVATGIALFHVAKIRA